MRNARLNEKPNVTRDDAHVTSISANVVLARVAVAASNTMSRSAAAGVALPDFFRDAPSGIDDVDLLGELGGEMEDDLQFGDGFEVSMDGLPDEMFALAGEPPTAQLAEEHDDLAAITGNASAGRGDWSKTLFERGRLGQDQRQVRVM